MTPEPLFPYDAFASYATDLIVIWCVPSRLLSKGSIGAQVFHRHLNCELPLCVDDRDFRIPRRGDRIAVNPQTVGYIVESNMKRTRALVVLCGPQSRDHP